MRKNQCMHCAEPGCLEACPSDGAIVQYTNGIVDFSRQVHRLRYCITGCPFNIPKFNKERSAFTSALCARIASARDLNQRASSRATGCLHFGSKDDMKYLAEQRANSYATTTTFRRRESTITGVGGTGVIYVAA